VVCSGRYLLLVYSNNVDIRVFLGVQCGECPRSFRVPRNFNSGNRNTRSRSNACSVSFVQEVEKGTVFTCEMVGNQDMHNTQRAYLGVRTRAFQIYREIASGEKLKISVLKIWTTSKIIVLASQYSVL
jgi:hypothetical protein